MAIRVATPDDLPALVRVINRAYEVEAHIFHGDRTSEREVRDRLGRPNASFLAIDDVDPAAPAGALSGAVYVELRGERGYFGMLAVDPDRQGRGFGRRLVEAAADHCRTAGCTWVDIDVVDLRSELPPFYAALGFTTIGTTPYPDRAGTKQPVNLIQMTRPL